MFINDRMRSDRGARGQITAAEAEAIAIEALGFIASEPGLFDRFCGVTGLSAGEIRAAAGEPGFLAGVMGFITDHEPTLLSFAAHADRSPETIADARIRLQGPDGSLQE